jgi:hypothetical protein
VEAAVVELHRGYGRARLSFDPYQAAQLTQRLRASGVGCDEFTFSAQSVGRLAVTLFRLLRDRALDLDGDDDGLIDELSHVHLREQSPGTYRIDHESGRHDDRVISLALAAQALVQAPSTAGRVAPAPMLTGRRWDGSAVRLAGLPGYER